MSEAEKPSRCAILPLRVYYEDTDAGGVVYYANYLRFLERARTEMLRTSGVEQAQLLHGDGIAFVVRALAADYLKPARLDDLVEVQSTIRELGRVQVVFKQQIVRGEEVLLDATVRVACIDIARGKPVAIPTELHQKFTTLMGVNA